MVKTVIIVLLVVLCGFLADRVVREENQRYALLVGMCTAQGPLDVPDFDCLEDVQTRTSWLWQLYYAVKDPLPSVPWSS